MEDKLAMVKFEDVLRQATHKVGVSLSDTQIGLFGLYLRELLEWNKTFNLTSIRDPEDIIIKHFVDSLTPLPYLELSGEILDIGPGAGFPAVHLEVGLPVAFEAHTPHGDTARDGRLEDARAHRLPVELDLARQADVDRDDPHRGGSSGS